MTHREVAGLGSRVAFELWLFAFIGFAGTTLLDLHPLVRIGAQLIFAVPVIGWVVVRPPRDVTAVEVAILLALGAHLIVAAFSLDPLASLAASGLAAAYAATYWVARDVDRSRRLRSAGVLAISVAGLFWLVVIAITWVVEKVALIQLFGWPPTLDAHQPYVWGSVNTPPLLALLLLPFVAWLPHGPLRTGALAVWAACALVIIPLSVGRAAWVGFVVALLAYEVASGFSATRRAWGAFGGAVAPRATLLGIGLFAALGVGFAAARTDLPTSLEARIRLWQQAVALFADDPITGAGPTTFSWARLIHVPAFADRVPARDAHSVPLQTLADGGLLLAVTFLMVAVAWVLLLLRRRGLRDPGRRLAAAVVVGYAAASLFDDLSFLPAVMVLLIVLAAWAVPPREETEPLTGHRQPALAAAAFALVLILSVPWVVQLSLVRLETEAARQAALAGDWEGALAGFQRAVGGQPRSALHWMSVGYAAERLDRVSVAVSAYETARGLSPGDARPWGALAALAADPSEAAELLETAAEWTRDAQYAYRLASGLESEIGAAEAVRFMSISVVMRPDILATLRLDEASAVAVALPEAIAEAGQLAPRHRHESLWDASLLLSTPLPADAPIQWRVAAATRDGDLARANDLLSEARRVDPSSVRTQQAAALVARSACDREAFERADRLMELAEDNRPAPRHEIADDRTIGLYREPELGDYQPIDGPRVPEGQPWPFGLIEVPDCGW